MVDKSRSSARVSQEFPVKSASTLSESSRGEEDDSKKSSLEIGRLRRASFMIRKSSGGSAVSTDLRNSVGNMRGEHPHSSESLEIMDGVYPKPAGELSAT